MPCWQRSALCTLAASAPLAHRPLHREPQGGRRRIRLLAGAAAGLAAREAAGASRLLAAAKPKGQRLPPPPLHACSPRVGSCTPEGRQLHCRHDCLLCLRPQGLPGAPGRQQQRHSGAQQGAAVLYCRRAQRLHHRNGCSSSSSGGRQAGSQAGRQPGRVPWRVSSPHLPPLPAPALCYEQSTSAPQRNSHPPRSHTASTALRMLMLTSGHRHHSCAVSGAAPQELALEALQAAEHAQRSTADVEPAQGGPALMLRSMGAAIVWGQAGTCSPACGRASSST